MKRLIDSKTPLADVIIDTTKDGTKFAIRTTGHLLADQVVTQSLDTRGFLALPADPFEWKEKLNERISSEISLLAAIVSNWSDQVSDETKHCSLDTTIDPVESILPALKIDGKSMLELQVLNEEEKQKLSDTYEQGFCRAWIERYGYITQFYSFLGMFALRDCRIVKNIGDHLMHRCKNELNLPVHDLLEKSKSKAEKIMNGYVIEGLCPGIEFIF
jgi:hypothetical protein